MDCVEELGNACFKYVSSGYDFFFIKKFKKCVFKKTTAYLYSLVYPGRIRCCRRIRRRCCARLRSGRHNMHVRRGDDTLISSKIKVQRTVHM